MTDRLPSAEEVEHCAAFVATHAGPERQIAPTYLRQFASILAPSDAGKELEAVITRSNGRDIEPQDYYAALDLARRLVARIGVLEGTMTQRANGYAEVVKGMRAEMDVLKAEHDQIEAAERNRCHLIAKVYCTPSLHTIADTIADAIIRRDTLDTPTQEGKQT